MPENRAVRNIVVIGGSAGSFKLLTRLVAALPIDLPAALFIVIHIPAHGATYLSDILARHGLLPAARATHGEPIRPGRIYLPQPGYHLLLEKGYIRVNDGPRENYTRPAIDPLFRSAAYNYGPRVIGVLLSGLQKDGAVGLRLIKEHGGIAMIQDPADAPFPSMPQHALNRLGKTVDYVLPFVDIPLVLQQLVTGTALEYG
jgi:two-component system chemotaxis response regulator CheB